MITEEALKPALISIIIPCYNHARFLQAAFDSIWQQDYPSIEVIVVDDGSTDNTKELVNATKDVKYIFQKNKGLSAARNTGIKNSKGDFFIFLDADDWLLPGAVKLNLSYFSVYPDIAFVSGGHNKVYVDENKIYDGSMDITQDHYIHLLELNYIGMHATVMYQRWVFNEFSFDESLGACEDFDLYLKVARKYPVHHHTKNIASYRLHTSNMSNNTAKMLYHVIVVLKRQRKNLKNLDEQNAYKAGMLEWKRYYGMELFENMMLKDKLASFSECIILIRYCPSLAAKYFLNKIFKRKKF